jgi:hypothetical protein
MMAISAGLEKLRLVEVRQLCMRTQLSSAGKCGGLGR